MQTPRFWLLLAHQLPPKSGYLRVKMWRRLREIGAVALKNALYILPATSQAREDFHRLLQELERGGGEGAVYEAQLAEGMNDKDIESRFRAAREADYQRLARYLRTLAHSVRQKKNRPADLKLKLEKARQQLDDIARRDFFHADGSALVEKLLSQLEHGHITRTETASSGTPVFKSLAGNIWVTRRDVHVDRIACAWLIRRFVDAEAKFLFVADRKHRKAPGRLGFDMAEAEFTHEGDKCSFEVLSERVAPADAALRAIAEIIHDLDLKDSKFARPETSGIGHVIEGICATQKNDLDRVARGSALFDDTYERFRRDPR